MWFENVGKDPTGKKKFIMRWPLKGAVKHDRKRSKPSDDWPKWIVKEVKLKGCKYGMSLHYFALFGQKVLILPINLAHISVYGCLSD